MSKGFYTTLWIFLGLFIFIVGAYAVPDYKINSQGVFVDNNRSFARTADVVVCRGQNTLDDVVKQFQCDVVCASTDSDCAQELQTAFSRGGNILSMPSKAIYPINMSISNYTGTGISIGYSIIISQSNVDFNGNGAHFIWGGTKQSGVYNAPLLINGSFVRVSNFKITNTTLAGSGLGDIGLTVIDTDFVEVSFVNVSKINGHEISIQSQNKNVSNIYVHDNYAEGIGSADVIGGGGQALGGTGNTWLKDSVFERNKIVQKSGSYNIAFDVVGVDNVIVRDNYIYGHAYFGFEKPAVNSKMLNNKIYPYVGGLNSTVSDQNLSSQDNYFIGNIIENGHFYILSKEAKVLNNIILVQDSSSTFTGLYTLIDGNEFNSFSAITDVTLATSNLQTFTNNRVNGGSTGIYASSALNNVRGNVFFNQTSRPISFDGTQNVADNNLIYVPAGTTLNWIFGDAGSNLVFANNVIHNQGSISFWNNNAAIMNNASIYNNEIIGNRINVPYFASGNATSAQIYIDNYLYPSAISALPCFTSNTSVFDQRTVYNSTTQCTCIGGAWKCWSMT